MSYRNIKPIVDAETGQPLNNVEVVKRIHKELMKLKEGQPGDSEIQKAKNRATLDKITNGNTDKVLAWCEQIVNCQDETVAQNLIASTIIPLPTVSK